MIPTLLVPNGFLKKKKEKEKEKEKHRIAKCCQNWVLEKTMNTSLLDENHVIPKIFALELELELILALCCGNEWLAFARCAVCS